MTEIWRQVVGYEGLYEVSSLGRVRTLGRMRKCINGGGSYWQGPRLRATPIDHTSTGYRYVGLFKDGKNTKHMVHSLVLESFVGPRPIGMECCHNDGDRANAKLANLRWDTKRGNKADQVLHGTAPRGENGPRAILTVELTQWIRESPQSSASIAPVFGVSASTVRAVRIGQNWVVASLPKARAVAAGWRFTAGRIIAP